MLRRSQSTEASNVQLFDLNVCSGSELPQGETTAAPILESAKNAPWVRGTSPTSRMHTFKPAYLVT